MQLGGIGINIVYIGNSKNMLAYLLNSKFFSVVGVVCEEKRNNEQIVCLCKKKQIEIVFVKNKKMLAACLLNWNISVAVMYEFGIIVPDEVIKFIDVFNFHPGSLIENRGSSPIHWSILQGKMETEMSLYKITKEIDLGEVVAIEKCQIDKKAIPSTLKLQLENKIPKLLIQLELFIKEKRKGTIIKDGIYRPRLKESDYTIDIYKDNEFEIDCKIRSQLDYKGAILMKDSEKYYIKSFQEYYELMILERREEMNNSPLEIEKKFVMTDFPLNVAVEPTTFCNLNCIMCDNNQITRSKGQMHILLYKKIVDEIAEESPKTRLWLDFYGEPLLVKYKLYYMIDYARKKGIDNICLNTNGQLLNEELAEMLLDAGIEYISFDCDGYSKEVYEKIRRNGKREVFYNNVEYILKRKKERNLKRPIIEIKIIEMEENKEEIDQIIDYWRGKGAWTTCRRKSTWGGNERTVLMEQDAMKDRIACGHAIGQMAITWDGKVVNCGFDGHAQVIWGDVLKESIKKIWERRNEMLVKKHLNHVFSEIPDICKYCGNWRNVGEDRYDEDGNKVRKVYDIKGKLYEQ